MSVSTEHSTVAIPVRQSLILSVTCFSMLNRQQSEELANLMVDVTFSPMDIIVTEDAPVDSVYIIVTGEAEVTRKMTFEKRTHTALIASIGTGDTIGLNNTGFFSTTGKR